MQAISHACKGVEGHLIAYHLQATILYVQAAEKSLHHAQRRSYAVHIWLFSYCHTVTAVMNSLPRTQQRNSSTSTPSLCLVPRRPMMGASLKVADVKQFGPAPDAKIFIQVL